MRKNNKTILVTASAKRLGKFIISDLVKNGWAVALHYNTSKQLAEESAEELCKIITQ